MRGGGGCPGWLRRDKVSNSRVATNVAQCPERLISPLPAASSRHSKPVAQIRLYPSAVPMAVFDGRKSTAPYHRRNDSASRCGL